MAHPELIKEAYQRDIARIKPWTEEEQKECFRIVHKWESAAKQTSTDEMGPEELQKFEEEKQQAQEAANMCIEQNLKLVIYAAKLYRNRGVAIEDLIGAGNHGLVEAVKRFDPARGAQFSSYAMWRIKRYMLETIQESRSPVHIPKKILERVSAAKKKIMDILQKKQEPISSTDVIEVVEGLKIRNKEVRNAIIQLLQETPNKRSLDEQVSDQDKRVLKDIIPSNNDKKVYEILEEEETKEVDMTNMNQLVGLLKPKKRIVMKMLVGIPLNEEELSALKHEQKKAYFTRLKNGVTNRCASVGRILNLTRERIRQIQEEAVQKWRRYSRRKLHPTVREDNQCDST